MYEEVNMLDYEDENFDWSILEGYSIKFVDPPKAIREEWFTAGQYCNVCKGRAEDHHTHKYCTTCNQVSDRNRYPFIDQCKCKKKNKQNDWDIQSSSSTQIILDQPNPRPIKQRKIKHQLSDYSFEEIPRTNINFQEQQDDC